MDEGASISFTTLLVVLIALILVGLLFNYMPIIAGDPDSNGLLMDFIEHVATTTVAP